MCNKQCSYCKKEKNIEQFLTEDGKERSTCDTCYLRRKEICGKYLKNNPEKRKESNKNYREANRDKIRELGKKRRTEQSDKISEISRQSVIKRMNENPLIKLKYSLRQKSLTAVKNSKHGGEYYCTLLGCTYDFLKSYIESQFTDGMTWENQGKYGWHVEHIIPLNQAETEEELYKLMLVENIRPLWGKENLYKAKEMRPEDIEIYLNRVMVYG